MPQHQVFISYNRDADLALPVAEVLKARSLNPWLERWHLPPGQPWLQMPETGLTAATSVAVLIAPMAWAPCSRPRWPWTWRPACRTGATSCGRPSSPAATGTPSAEPSATTWTVPLQDWIIPQLYQGGEGGGTDPVLVPVGEAPAQAPSPTPAVDLPWLGWFEGACSSGLRKSRRTAPSGVGPGEPLSPTTRRYSPEAAS
jgi:hypothetical protein